MGLHWREKEGEEVAGKEVAGEKRHQNAAEITAEIKILFRVKQ